MSWSKTPSGEGGSAGADGRLSGELNQVPPQGLRTMYLANVPGTFVLITWALDLPAVACPGCPFRRWGG